ncbi:MAG: hypothetical protein IJL37_05285 [Bacteroidaceae bacterium]|nr:hypothetical protein [Bacteroidaceae bacterium]
MITIICVIVVLVVLVGMYFSYNNKEVALRKEAEAQKGKIEGVHDKMWKVIQQKAEVSNEYREAFEKIYPELISGRYANDNGNVMKWIQESNPNFDTALYKDLQQAIEIQREYFNNAQTRMLDVIKERETLIETYPAKWFISNKSKIEYEVISSSATKGTMTTGIDDEVSVFKK